MHYTFIAPGTTIENNTDNRLYLDVGNSLQFGIIDHHHLRSRQSATHLVYNHPELISPETDEIVLHNSPDLDCIAASYLTVQYLEKKAFPSYSKELVAFLDKSDFGKPIKNIINLASLFTIIKSTCQDDAEIVHKGHKLINDLANYGFYSGNIPKKYLSLKDMIDEDYNLYKDQFDNFSTTSYNLPLKSDHTQYQKTKCLIMDQPQARLFKDWARADGYDMLIVQWPKKRTVISVRADGVVNLLGVGDRLNSAEKRKRKELSISIDEPNRPGYDMPDPWYDGRAHDYTIIDSPRIGTCLEFEEILYSLQNY